jgi:excisionase family DNA binding protein
MSYTGKTVTTREVVQDRLRDLSIRPTFITIKEAANMLGLAPDTVHHLKGGTHKLTRVRHGRAVRMIRQEIDAHIQQQIKASQRNSIN